jgi:hypothetical protein
VDYDRKWVESPPSAVQIIKVPMVLRLFQTEVDVLLRLGHILEVHWHLETLQVLHYPRELMILVEI